MIFIELKGGMLEFGKECLVIMIYIVQLCNNYIRYRFTNLKVVVLEEYRR